MKSPFNWVGNKYKYTKQINDLINKDYDKVIDVFMGSGNILFNLDVKANQYIGNDIIPLMPVIYKSLSSYKYNFDLNDFLCIENKYNDFTDKTDYYTFRDNWNEKYKTVLRYEFLIDDSVFDGSFILRTLLLFKMCSNSMIRFNKKGEFNQGFRGCHGSFFNEVTKNNIINELNNLNDYLLNVNVDFTNFDCLELLDVLNNTNNSLIILDPPYLLSSLGMYDMTYNKEKDLQILEYLYNTNNDFIYFNYLSSDDFKYNELQDFIKHFNYIEINNKNCSGQNRKINVKDVKEILVYKL